ncbi:MAG: PEP-CTERM sorting domain-containing protein [Phycisphaerales bacterium]
MRSPTMRRVLPGLFLAAAVAPAMGQATFTGVGDLKGGGEYSEVLGLSGDGQTVVGASIVGGSGFSQVFGAFRWTGAGLEAVYQNPAGESVRAQAASFSGGVIAGFADFGFFSTLGVQAFIWTPSTGAYLVGDLPGGSSGVPRSYARAVSADGAVVACIGESVEGTEAFRYEVATGGMTGLGDLPGGPFASYGYGISADGSTIVGLSLSGAQTQESFMWREATGMVGLGFLPVAAGGVQFSQATAASADGAVIVGQSRTAVSINANEAFRWTESSGLVGLGDLPGGGFDSIAFGVSADGSVIVGRASVDQLPPCGIFGCGSAGRAFIWDAVNGMRDLEAVLSAAGATTEGWDLQEARAVSADGRTIAGTGRNPTGAFEGWVAYFPPEPVCYADCNVSGTLTVADFGCFQSTYVLGDLYADCNGSGALSVADFGCFQGKYVLGCP